MFIFFTGKKMYKYSLVFDNLCVKYLIFPAFSAILLSAENSENNIGDVSMKKFLSALLAGVMACTMAIGFAGCGDDDEAKTIKGKDDLKGAIIGVQAGTTGDDEASKFKDEGSTINRYDKGADAIVALKNGKIDCVVIDNEPAKAFVAENDDLKILDEPLTEEEYAIAMPKDKTDLLDKFNKALKELKDDGTITNIINNYIGDKTGKSAYTTPSGTKYPNGELHMATSADFPPYESTLNGDVVGIDPMIAQAICDKLGYELVIDNMKFTAVIASINSGKADFAMSGLTVTDERKQSVNFTDTYITANQVIIVKK